MSVRAAKFVDIPRMTTIYDQARERSVYSGRATLDLTEVKQMLARAISRHGHKTNGGSLVLVSERDGQAEGFILGILDQVYPCAKELMATDLLFIFSERADPRDARKMVRQIVEWGEQNPKVLEVRLGITDAIGDWRRTGKLYQSIGLEQAGALFVRRFG